MKRLPLLAAALLTTAALAEPAVPAGRAVFERQCAACHQADGRGLPGMAPALAQVLAPLAEQPEGQRYLVQVLVHGLSGRIVTQGQAFTGAMPPQGGLSDAELADVANYLVRDLNGAATSPYAAADFARTRSEKVTHKELRDLRGRFIR